jgi:hypothetical protein
MKKPEPKLPPSMRKVDAFVNAGGEVAAEKTEKPASDKLIVSYTLRVYSSKLEELAAVRDARKAEKLAEGKPDRNTISVHSLLLEAIDSFLKQEAKRVVKKAAGKSVKK